MGKRICDLNLAGRAWAIPSWAVFIALCSVCSPSLNSCGGKQTSTESQRQKMPPPEAEPTAPAKDHMKQHFNDVMQARDAVIQGDLEGAKLPLERIADAKYAGDFPPDWQDWVAQMQTMAATGAKATSLSDAAEQVSTLSAACADCHRATGKGPSGDRNAKPPAPGENGAKGPRGGLKYKMAMHAWGADQLWLGLTAPSHEAWVRGWSALVGKGLDAPMEERDNKKKVTPAEETPPEAEDARPSKAQDFSVKMKEIEVLGKSAEGATTPTQKAEVYQALLTRCATCHTRR